MVEDEPEDFSWQAFFELAERLAAAPDEASLRTAVSRSYYAVYNRAREMLEHLDPDYEPHRTRESHKQVWDRVAARTERQAKTAARSGKSLMHKRVEADYHLDRGQWDKQSRDALAEARRALNSIDDLMN